MDNLSIKYPLFLSIFHYSKCYHFHAVVTKIYEKTCPSLLRIIYSYFCELNFSSVYSVLCNKVPTYLVSTYNFGRWEIFHFNIMYLKICIATAITLLCIFNEPILTWITYMENILISFSQGVLIFQEQKEISISNRWIELDS